MMHETHRQQVRHWGGGTGGRMDVSYLANKARQGTREKDVRLSGLGRGAAGFAAGLLSWSVQFSARSGRALGGTNRCAAG
jgi:hypothetical protein